MRDRPRIPPVSNGIRIMTSLATIAICKSELARQKELDPATAQRLGAMEWGALAWWSRHPGLRVPQHEGCGGMAALTAFYQWSLERAAVFLGVDTLGGRSWFLEGTAHLLGSQSEAGTWDGRRGTPIADTAFSILFLKRGWIPIENPKPVLPPVSDRPTK
jgi:hypothetical protein